MTWRSSDLIERLGIRICFSGGIGDGSDAGGFGGDAGGFGGDAGGYGGDSGGLGSDMGGDVSGDMGGDFGGDSSADSYGGDAGLGSDGYGSDMAASDGYGSDVSDASYGGDMGMDAGAADVGLGSESEDGLGGYTDGGDYGSDVAAGTGNLGVDTSAVGLGDDPGGFSADADDSALAGETEAISAADGDLSLTSEVDGGLAAGSLETSDLSAPAFDGPVQEGWSETGGITTADLDPTGEVESYTSDMDLGLTDYETDPNLAAASYSASIATDPNVGVPEATMPDDYSMDPNLGTEAYTSFNAGLEAEELGTPESFEDDVVPPEIDQASLTQASFMPDELNTPFDVELEAGWKDKLGVAIGTYIAEKLADFGLEKIGENLPEADTRGLEQVKPGPLDPMGSYTGAADLYESPSTQAPSPTGATGAASQHSQTADLFGPNPIGSGAETFEPEPGEVGPNPRTFEQP